MAMSEYFLRIDRFTQNRFTGDPEVDVNPERIDREKNLHVYLTGNIRPDRSVKLIAFKSPSPSAKPAADPENPPPYLADAESAAAQSYKASLPHYSLPDRSTVYLLKAFDASGQPWAVTSHELKTTDAVLTSELTVDAFPRDSEETAVVAAARPVDTQLTDGPGIFGYYPASKRWGTASTVAALREVGRIWQLRRYMPRVGVGDISLRGGGDIEGHASHETGRDVDLRPIRNDGTERPVTWGQANYSRALTQELIDIICANGVVKVKVIGFNDPGVQGCVNWVNHDNHLHVRFFFEDEAPGYPLLKFGMNSSPPVRECQRRLNNWKQMQGDTDRLTPDGDFGQNTLQAVQDFQAAIGLVVDGKVGNETWKQTLGYLVSDPDEPIPVTAEVDGGTDWAQDLRRTLTTALTQLAHVDAIGIDAPYSDVRPGNAITPGAMPAAATAEQTRSEAGVRFIAGFEGFRSRLYNDPGGHCTIGYGHLVHHGRCNGNEPEEFKQGISQKRGLELLGQDADVAERAVNRRVQVVLTQSQFDALVSFAFNVGTGAFGGSTLLRRLNGGEYDAVPAELMRWVNSGGTQLPGLVRRRRAEGVLFSQGSYGDVDAPADADISEGPYAIADVPADADIPEVERNDDRANMIEKPGADQCSM
jgi:lysozyme